MVNHTKWANEQYDGLIELGINPIDAQRTIDFILDNLPLGEDPATYIFPASALWQDPASQVDDAAAAWMASETVPNRFKRILSAKAED